VNGGGSDWTWAGCKRLATARRAWLTVIGIPILLCAAQALVLLRHIDRPGLYYDEILFVNAAVGGLGDQFVALRIGGIPVMLMHYIGALKAWIWAPIFAIWDVEAASVRIPAVVIGLAGNVLACIAMGCMFGRTAAVVAAFAICFDPTVGMQSRLDWGPNATMYLCRGGFLLSVALATTGRPRSGLLGMVVFAAAGSFDKLSFLWIAVPGIATFVLLYWDLIRDRLRLHRSATIAWALGIGVVVGAPLLLALIVPLRSEQVSLAERPLQAARLLWSALAGDGAISVVYWGKAGRHGTQAALVVGALVLAAVLGVGSLRQQQPRWWRAWIWLCTFCALVVLMFAGTRAATGPHHAAVIGGLWQLPFVPPIASGIARTFAARAPTHLGLVQPVARGVPVAVAQCALVAVASVTCLTMTWQRVSALSAPPVNPNWDAANWNVGSYVATSTDEPVVFVEWGMANQAIALTRGRSGRIADEWTAFLTEESAQDLLRAHDVSTLYCLRMPQFEEMRGNRDRFLGAAAVLGLTPTRVAAFATEGGTDMIELVRLVPAAGPATGVK
jgi:hypothetical protein